MGRPKGGTNKRWSAQEKYDVIKPIVEGKVSAEQRAKDLGIKSAGMVRKWVGLYLAKGIKGLENENKVFMPYYTDSGDTDHMGLGLYICKQYLASMGGNLLYSRENNQTCFTLFLPLA